jgi:hypothetical protein
MRPRKERIMTQQPRTIPPTDAQDERLASVPLSAAYTFAYLPTVLDDAGRIKDQPAVLNGYLWPLRAEDHPTSAMVDDITALVDASLLCRYTVDDVAYLHDPAWKRRQQVGRVTSDLPPCPEHDKVLDDAVADTLGKVSEQVNAILGGAAGIDEEQVRDTVSRLVEDVTFMIDPDKASTFGQKVREFLGEPSTRHGSSDHIDVERIDTPDGNGKGNGVWGDVTDEP